MKILKADVNLLDGRRVTPLIDACNNGNLDVIKWLITIDEVDVNATDYRGLTPLMTVYYMGQLDAVKILVQSQRVDVNQPDRERRIPLTAAWRNMHIPVVKYLLQEVESLNVNFVGYNGNTALHYAVWYSRWDRTKLHQAVISGDEYRVSEFITSYYDLLDTQDNDGYSPLHLARMRNLKGIASILEVSGADESITDDWRNTATDVEKKDNELVMNDQFQHDSHYQIYIKDFSYHQFKRNRKRLLTWPLLRKYSGFSDCINTVL